MRGRAGESDELEEERRLCFVAFTLPSSAIRPRHANRTLAACAERTGTSPFLNEMPRRR